MPRGILKLEWRMARREPSLWIVLFTTVLLLLGSAWFTQRWVTAQQQSHQSARADEEERMALRQTEADAEVKRLHEAGEALEPVKFGARHATHIGHYSGKRYAMLPSAALTGLAVGDTDVQSSLVLVSVDPKQYAGSSTFHQPLWLRAGRFDPAFVLAFLLPLLLIAAIGPVLSGDRSGPLAMLTAQGASLSHIALIRIVVRGVPVLATATLSLLGIAMLQASPEGLTSAVWWSPMLLVLGLSNVYGLFWMVLAALVDSRMNRESATPLLLAGCWLLFAVLLPAAIHLAAVTWFPVDSRARFEELVREVQQEVWSEGQRDAILDRFFQTHPDIDRKSVGSLEQFMIYQMRTIVEAQQRTKDQDASYAKQRQAQQAFLARMCFLSPVLVFQTAFEDAAGVGELRRAAYHSQLASFIKSWEEYFIPKIYYRTAISDLSQTPQFHFQEPALATVVRATAIPLLAMIVAIILMLLLAIRFYQNQLPLYTSGRP